jgi:phage tail-like protein
MAVNRVDPSTGFRFAVALDGVNLAAFTEFRLPSLSVQTVDIQEGGQNTYVHKLPVRVNVGPATLRHGISKDLTLLKWYLQVLKGDLENAYRQVTVVMYDVGRVPVATWTFREAIPVKWSGPTMKTDDNGVAIEEIEFIHHGFEVE